MIRAHHQAVLGLLTGISDLTVYDGIVPNLPALPYAVLWASTPLRYTDRMCGDQINARLVFSTHAVASTSVQVGWVQEKLNAALLGATVTVAGRSCERIQSFEYGSGKPDIDYDVDPPVLTAVDSWLFVSVPA